MSNQVSKFDPSSPDPRQLLSTLDRLSGSAQKFLLRARLREEFRNAIGVAPVALFVFPLLLLLVRATGSLLGYAYAPVSVWLVAGLAVLGPVVYVLGRLAVAYRRYSPRRQNALALYDKQLNTQDRLVTADEFIDQSSSAGANRSAYDHSHGFKLAAIADADSTARAALAASLTPFSLDEWRLRRSNWFGVAAALAICALLMLGFGSRESDTPAGKNAVLAALVPTDAAVSAEERKLRQAQHQRRPDATPDQQELAAEPQSAMLNKNKQSRNDKSPEGQSQAGNSAMAKAVNTASTATGNPSSQKNASKPKKPEEQNEEEETKAGKQKKRTPKKEEKKSSQMAMASSSGEGRSAMSSSSTNEMELQEEEERGGIGSKMEGLDEESEDEDEQEKSHSASKPGLQNKKTPTSRDLGAGPPGYPIPYGRSGPGNRKKTRGVASMVLGIPLIDRIQGQTNKGRSKVTQEDAKPKQESHAQLNAQTRLARNDIIGRIEEPVMLPWMRTLVENYFTALRKNTGLFDEAGDEVAETPAATVEPVSSDDVER